MTKITVVVRTNGERTIDLCCRLLQEQIDPGYVFVINEKPFFSAVEKTFAIGAGTDTQYLFALDADVLLFRDAINYTVSEAERKMNDHVFRIDFPILDKFRDRVIGSHLYNNAYSKAFLEFLNANPESPTYLRAESDNIGRFSQAFGLDWAGIEPKHSVGYHDYHQFLKDIVRKYASRYQRCLIDNNLDATVGGLHDKIARDPNDMEYRFVMDTLLGHMAGSPPAIADLLKKYNVREIGPLDDAEMRKITASIPPVNNRAFKVSE